jgi:glutathione S-transferase
MEELEEDAMDAKLYHLESCPYCRKARAFAAQRGLERYIEFHEVSREPDALKRLVELTGRSQVPVLEVDDEPLVGSELIIDWLDENAVALARGPDARIRRNRGQKSGSDLHFDDRP